MNWNRSIRQTHRWLSIAFTIGFLIVWIASSGGEEPPEALYLMPLIPLFLLLITGLYLFVLPYVGKGRGERRPE